MLFSKLLNAFDRLTYVSHLWGLIPKNYDGTVFLWWVTRHVLYVWGAFRLWKARTISYLGIGGLWVAIHVYRGARLQATDYRSYTYKGPEVIPSAAPHPDTTIDTGLEEIVVFKGIGK